MEDQHEDRPDDCTGLEGWRRSEDGLYRLRVIGGYLEWREGWDSINFAEDTAS